MSKFKGLSIQVSAGLGLQSKYRIRPQADVTTLLYHRFVHGGESLSTARARLHQQLRWLSGEYQPVTLEAVANAARGGQLPRNALLVTVDDVSSEMLDVMDVFQQFGVPPALFACVGWTAGSSPLDKLNRRELVARAISGVHWYTGTACRVRLGGRELELQAATREAVCDALMAASEDEETKLDELRGLCKLLLPDVGPDTRHTICGWSDLQQLETAGASIGAHSISHARLAALSPRRLAYEMREAKQLIEDRIGPCHDLAYPYGLVGTFDNRTRQAAAQAGYRSAFVTEPGFSDASTDILELPRFTLPDSVLSMGEFRARVRGGGIAVRRVTDWAKSISRPRPRPAGTQRPA